MKLQFRVLFRQFLFRMADLEALSAHAQGDTNKLLGQFAALLIFISMVLAIVALGFAGNSMPPEQGLALTLDMENFLIATTMLVVGLFAVLCWDSTFPDRRDVLVLAPLPVRARTLFLAKIAAVGTALALTVGFLNGLSGFAWPLAFATHAKPQIVPALTFDRDAAPLEPGRLKAVMDRDLRQVLSSGVITPGVGIAIGVVRHGERSVVTYGTAKPDSIFEIGSISKTFTALLLARMAAEGQVRLDQPVRELLPPNTLSKPGGPEITLLDLATHHSGLPRSASVRAADPRFPPRGSDVIRTLGRLTVAKPERTSFEYSNFGAAVLGHALAARAGSEYPQLLQSQIIGPLGLQDTTVFLSAEQESRSLQGYSHGATVPPWEANGYEPAGAIRSTAGDLLTYLEAQLHPEGIPSLASALQASHELHAKAAPGSRIALAWMFRQDTGTYAHGGATRGFTAHSFFCPKDDYAGVVLLNNWAGADVVGEHLRQRLAGEPAISLETVQLSASGSFLRWFAAYWTTIIAAAVFLFCCVLGVQGVAAQLLPRRLFLRASGALQMAAFCLFVGVYFLQPPFPGPDALLTSEGRRQLALFPSYWFVGLFHQLNGSMHPALAPLARRAWTALAIALAGTATAYLLAYVRTLRQIVEEPDIVPGVRGGGWTPRFGGPLPTAVGQFSVRTLLRSRQHRVILAFYLGIAFALMVWFLKSPSVQKELAERDPWRQVNAPMLAASIIAMGFCIVGTRVVFALPLDLRANWIFRAAPVAAGPAILVARRRTMFALSVLPAWTAAAVVFLWLWPLRVAVIHLAALGLFGLVAAEICLRGPQKIPFTCSYLPGKSNVNVAFWLYILVVFQAINVATKWEIGAFDDAWKLAKMFITLAAAGAVLRWRSSSEAASDVAELRYEEAPDSAIQQLRLEAHAGYPAGI